MAKDKKDLSSKDDLLNLKGFLTFLILHELNSAPLCGDELSKNIGKRKGVPLTPGTIYPTLKRLRKMKLMNYKRAGRKKNYVLTELGKSEIHRLYALFGNYFYGLKDKLPKKPIDLTKHAHTNKKHESKTLQNA